MIRFITLTFFVLLSVVGPVQAASKNPHDLSKFLDGRIPEVSGRYETFLLALELMQKRKAKVIVETGTARYGSGNFIGDGGSTIIFGDWARKNNAVLYSIDIDEGALYNAYQNLGDSTKAVHLVHSDSVEFLRRFNQTIDFLYLDSYDFDCFNPDPSQEHHLNEIIAAYPYLRENSVVMIDDCDLPHGGKGKLVIDYLLKRGWKILAEQYQVILSKKI